MSCTDKTETSGDPEGGQRSVLNIDSAGSTSDSNIPILDWSVPVDAYSHLHKGD